MATIQGVEIGAQLLRHQDSADIQGTETAPMFKTPRRGCRGQRSSAASSCSPAHVFLIGLIAII